MKEADYIKATNLAKIRIVSQILRSLHVDGVQTVELNKIIRTMDQWEDKLIGLMDL